jgi:hypothetical protein
MQDSQQQLIRSQEKHYITEQTKNIPFVSTTISTEFTYFVFICLLILSIKKKINVESVSW